MPRELSAGQVQLVKDGLTKFNPSILSKSPFVDANGAAIEFRVTKENINNKWANARFAFRAEEIPESAQKRISNLFDHYADHRQWEEEHLEVKVMTPENIHERQQGLLGQEGLFAKETIAENTVISVFGGMLLEKPEDIALDQKLRELASCDDYKSKTNGERIIQGMGLPMKVNAANDVGWMDGDLHKNNVDGILMMATQKTDKSEDKQTRILLFSANRDILAGEQLCYDYDVRPPAQRAIKLDLKKLWAEAKNKELESEKLQHSRQDHGNPSER